MLYRNSGTNNCACTVTTYKLNAHGIQDAGTVMSFGHPAVAKVPKTESRYAVIFEGSRLKLFLAALYDVDCVWGLVTFKNPRR